MRAFVYFCLLCVCVLCAHGDSNSSALPLLQKEWQQTQQEPKDMFPFETGKSPLENISFLQYFGVILILVGLLVLLWIIKNRLNHPHLRKPSNPLSKFFTKETGTECVQIESITTLGINNRLIIFEAYQKRYFVIINQNQIALIDSYPLKDGECFKDLLEQDNAKS